MNIVGHRNIGTSEYWDIGNLYTLYFMFLVSVGYSLPTALAFIFREAWLNRYITEMLANDLKSFNDELRSELLLVSPGSLIPSSMSDTTRSTDGRSQESQSTTDSAPSSPSQNRFSNKLRKLTTGERSSSISSPSSCPPIQKPNVE